MLLAVCFDAGADIVEAPAFIVENIEDYRKPFKKWLSDINNNHGYWDYDEDGNIKGLNYRSDALVEWLNAFPLADNDEKAKTIETFVWDYHIRIPAIDF